MSEYINNRDKRQQVLKKLIRQLHEGKTVEDIKEEFATLLRDVSPMEVAKIEQALIDEGMPETEVKRLCDVHVAVFRESLEAQAKPDTVPGHPVYTFLAENGAAGRVLDELQGALEALKTTPDADHLEQARGRLRELREYEKHYLRKENILFPYLEKHGFTGPSSVMWAIHDDIRAGWKKLDELLAGEPDQATVVRTFEPLATAIGEMFYKEENILFPTALEKLSQEEWAAIRAQEPEVGYCYVEPGEERFPEIAAPPEAPQAKAEGLVPLQTGALTAQQIALLLTHLPDLPSSKLRQMKSQAERNGVKRLILAEDGLRIRI